MYTPLNSILPILQSVDWNKKAHDIMSKYHVHDSGTGKKELEKLLKEFLALIDEKLFD